MGDHPGKLNHAKLEKQKPKGKGGKGASTTEVVEVYKGGFTPSIHIRTAKAPCQIVESPMYIEAGDQAEVIFHPKLPLVVSPFDECKPLGRIAAMDSNSLIMLGKVTKVEYKAADKK